MRDQVRSWRRSVKNFYTEATMQSTSPILWLTGRISHCGVY